MAIISLPQTTSFARKISWQLDRPAQINRSAYTGQRQVLANPWHAKWTGTVEFSPVVGEAEMRTWRAFFAQLRGQINTFRLIAVEASQAASNVAVGTLAAATATSLQISGGPASVTLLKAGAMATVNDQLLVLTSDLVTNASGVGTMAFEPPLRVAAAVNAVVYISYPTALVCLSSSVSGWSAEPGVVYGMAMTFEEVYSAAIVAAPTPGNTALPVITGTTTQGSTLSTTNGTWTNTPTSYAYQWTRAGANIAGATAATYTLVAGDVGANIAVVVTATNANGNGAATAASVGPITTAAAPANTVAPAITGTTQVSSTLTVSDGTWSNMP